MPSTKKASGTQADKFRDLAGIVLKHHFGNRAANITPKSGGLSNFVFEGKHAEGDFIVRISPDPARLNQFIKEQWCERAARRAGIPTAEILETGGSVIPFPYAVSRSVGGTEGTDHPERSKIIAELGRYAKKINSIRTRGFGETFDWSNNELSRNKTLKEYLEGEYQCEARIETLERSGLSSPATVKSVRRIVREMLSIKTLPVLNHGDLRLKNVIADDAGKITAIIDWEKATSNVAPQWEFSVALHDLGVDGQEQFVKGYGMPPKRLAEVAPYVKAFNLLNYTDKINEAIARKDKATLAQFRMRFSGAFDMYSFA
ncbi:MAG TPA: aminoglycoside phosphotransferase family protein [Pyrinomonadaceae bacterium]|nr:aminoglycoside phosphotransferase family protein [Pyrinomonadaceae bacterium]